MPRVSQPTSFTAREASAPPTLAQRRLGDRHRLFQAADRKTDCEPAPSHTLSAQALGRPANAFKIRARRTGFTPNGFAQKCLPRSGDTFPGAEETAATSPGHPGCLHVRLPGVDAADLLLRLQPTVAAAIGSACTSGQIGASHVLRALEWDEAAAGEALRFSVGRFTTEADVALLDDALETLWATAA